jgi:3-hydroxyisobutyrate dehydrogenase
MTRVALIGTGGMGQGIAASLLQAGFDLTVCNRSPAKAQPLVDLGAAWSATPRQAAQDADYILSIVGDDRDSQAVWLGADGVLAGRPADGAVAVECTTLSLAWVNRLAERLSAAGLGFIDCPVTGGRQGAAQGALTLLVGAEDPVLARARPLLAAFGNRILHFGPVGAGTAYKLAVNLMVGVQTVALAEALLLTEQQGLDPAQVVEALTAGAAASPVVKAYAGRMASADHAQVVAFSARWMAKDLRYALQMAAGLDLPTPTLAAASQVFETALTLTPAEKDVVYVIEALRPPAGDLP